MCVRAMLGGIVIATVLSLVRETLGAPSIASKSWPHMKSYDIWGSRNTTTATVDNNDDFNVNFTVKLEMNFDDEPNDTLLHDYRHKTNSRNKKGEDLGLKF